MINEQYYLSDHGNLERAVIDTGLDREEILSIVGGLFTKNSRWSGKPKGKIVITFDKIFIKTSFGNRTLWKEELEEM